MYTIKLKLNNGFRIVVLFLDLFYNNILITVLKLYRNHYLSYIYEIGEYIKFNIILA